MIGPRAALDRSLAGRVLPAGVATIAVSGGLDSTVLARLVVPRLGRPCRLACFDHGWRPFQAEIDQVRALAQSLSVPLVLGRAPPRADRLRAVGPEAAAREARRRWLESLGRGPIFLGHHQDDQRESALLHGVTMGVLNGRYVRPLLGARRRSLEALARSEGWTWVDDPTNSDLRRPRNVLRHRALPAMSRAAVESALDRAESERARRASIRARAQAALPALLRATSPSHRRVDASGLLDLDDPLAAEILRGLCPTRGRGISRSALTVVLAALKGGGRGPWDLGSGWSLHRRGDDVHLDQGCAPPPAVRPLIPGTVARWSGVGAIGRRRVARARPQALDRRRALLAGSDLPLWLGPAGSGRRMRPFGLGGSKLVSDLLREAGVAPPRRASWPVVLDHADRVLWIPGVRASEHAPLPTGGADATLLLLTDGTGSS